VASSSENGGPGRGDEPARATRAISEGFDEGLDSSGPLAVRIGRWLFGGLARLGSKPDRLYRRLGWLMLIGVATPAVVAVEHFWFSLMLVALFLVGGSFVPHISRDWRDWLYRVQLGRPVFGVYGGVPTHVLETTIACASDLSVTLPERDAQNLRSMALLNEDAVAADTKNAYLQVQNDLVGSDAAARGWETYWDQVRTKPRAGSTYEQALGENPDAFALVPGWLLRMVAAIPLAVIMLAIVTLLSPFAVENLSSTLPFMLSIAVAFGLLAAVVGAVIGRDRPGQTLELRPPDNFAADVDALALLPEQERDALKQRGNAVFGPSVRIIDIRLGPRCKSALAGFLGRQFLVVLLGNLVALLVIIGLSLAVAFPFAADRAKLVSAYGKQALLLTLVVAVALVAFRFWGFVIHQMGDIVGPLVGAAAAALTVAFGHYLVTGKLDFDLRTTAVTVGAAAVGLLGTKLGEALKR
jgi:hypothetical protein